MGNIVQTGLGLQLVLDYSHLIFIAALYKLR